MRKRSLCFVFVNNKTVIIHNARAAANKSNRPMLDLNVNWKYWWSQSAFSVDNQNKQVSREFGRESRHAVPWIGPRFNVHRRDERRLVGLLACWPVTAVTSARFPRVVRTPTLSGTPEQVARTTRSRSPAEGGDSDNWQPVVDVYSVERLTALTICVQ